MSVLRAWGELVLGIACFAISFLLDDPVTSRMFALASGAGIATGFHRFINGPGFCSTYRLWPRKRTGSSTMRLSIQRQCDGVTETTTCDQRLELCVEVPDPVDAASSARFIEAWESVALDLGWRRTAGPGETLALSKVGDTKYMIPSAKAWVVCPSCAEAMGLFGDKFDAETNHG